MSSWISGSSAACRSLAALACVVSTAIAQAGGEVKAERADLRFSFLESGRALRDRAIFVTVQDRRGFLWVGTNDGLLRFDGHEVVTYRHEPAVAGSLANNTVRRLVEDSAGRLWIRTEAGLDLLDRGTGMFVHYVVAAQQMLLDAAGNLLVAGPDGILRYEATRDAFDVVVPFDSLGGPARGDPVWGFVRGRDGRLWVTSESGWLFEAREGSTRIRATRTPWRYTVLGYQDAAGRIWIGHSGGVGVYRPDEERFADLEQQRRIAPTGSVIAIRAVSDSVVWISGAALSRVAVSSGHVIEVRAAVLPDAPLVRPVWWAMEDSRGVTWAATGRGLLIHDPYAAPIAVVPATVGASSDIPDPVMAILEDGQRRVWVGSLAGGARLLEASHSAPRPIAAGLGACTSSVWALLKASGRVWAGTSRGLCAGPSLPGLVPVSLTRPGAPVPIVFVLAADSSGRIWAGTSDGLAALDPRTGRVSWFERLWRDQQGVVRVEGLTVSGDGHVWVGTSHSDVYRIDPKTMDGMRVAVGDDPALQGSEGFWALIEDGDGRLLAGGDRGLFVVDAAAGRLEWLGPSAGIEARRVYALARDDAGNTWFSSDQGVTRLTRTAGGYLPRTFNRHDGVSITEFNRRSFARTSRGEFVFGGMGGVARFRPADVVDNPTPPTVVATGFERITPAGSEPMRTHDLTHVVLEAGDRGFSISFAALVLADARPLRYHYRLHGIDAEWVPAQTDRRARYPRLPPGQYTFTVRASVTEGTAEGSLELPITVPTPWAATWWFRGSLVLAGALSLAGIVRNVSTRRLANRVRALEVERRLQGERERISRDLHDNVGGQVASLMSGIELAQLSTASGQHERASAYLASVAADARLTLNQLRETVWSLRTEALTVRGLAEQIDDDLRTRRRYIERPSLAVTVHDDADRRLTSAQAMHLFRITQEAVSNAIAHADATRVTVEIRATGATVELTVRDDGRHPVSTHPPRGSGFGIHGMATRARDIGALFTWGRDVGGGTMVQVIIVLDRTASDGTEPSLVASYPRPGMA